MKCKTLSLCLYDGIVEGARPRYAAARVRTMKAPTIHNQSLHHASTQCWKAQGAPRGYLRMRIAALVFDSQFAQFAMTWCLLVLHAVCLDCTAASEQL